jgi:hypothetical protein
VKCHWKNAHRVEAVAFARLAEGAGAKNAIPAKAQAIVRLLQVKTVTVQAVTEAVRPPAPRVKAAVCAVNAAAAASGADFHEWEPPY